MKKLIIFLALILLAAPAFAVQLASAENTTDLIVPIGGQSSFPAATGPAEYLKTLYKYGIGLAALFAMLFIVIGGIKFTVSAGMPAQRESAMGMVKAAIGGLVLLLVAVAVLAFINPRLTDITPPDAQKILDEEAVRSGGTTFAETTKLRQMRSSQVEIADATYNAHKNDFWKRAPIIGPGGYVTYKNLTLFDEDGHKTLGKLIADAIIANENSYGNWDSLSANERAALEQGRQQAFFYYTAARAPYTENLSSNP